MGTEAFDKGVEAGEKAAAEAGVTSGTSTEGRMYVRTQGFGSTDAELRFLQRCGVKHKAAPVSYTHLTLPTTPYV